MTPGTHRLPTAATVVITTKNRKDDLRAAIASAIKQTANPEIIVVDDASTDGTAEMVRAEFPQVRLEVAAQSLGYIVQRNHAARIATGEIVFSIDDDAIFTTEKVVEQTLADFDDPRIGAVAIPFVDINIRPTVMQRAPDNIGTYITSNYVGTAHALRRELFLELGGYREYLFHQGEERDFSVRMMDGGHFVRMGRSDLIHHFESPKRDFRRRDLYGRRNDLLFAFHNAPMPAMLAVLARTTLGGLVFGLKVHRPLRMARGVLMGFADMLAAPGERKPVSLATFQLAQRLRRQSVMPIAEVAGKFGKT